MNTIKYAYEVIRFISAVLLLAILMQPTFCLAGLTSDGSLPFDEGIGPDTRKVTEAVVISMYGKPIPSTLAGKVTLSRETALQLSETNFKYENFRVLDVHILTEDEPAPSAVTFETKGIITFVDGDGRVGREMFEVTSAYENQGNSIRIIRAKKSLLRPKHPRMGILILEEKDIPADLFKPGRPFGLIMRYLAKYAIDPNQMVKGDAERYYLLFACCFDRSRTGGRFEFREGQASANVSGNLLETIDHSFDGWHIATTREKIALGGDKDGYIKVVHHDGHEGSPPQLVFCMPRQFKDAQQGNGTASGNGTGAGNGPGGNTGGVSLAPIADASVYAYAYQNWNKSNQGAFDKLGAGWNPAGGEKRAYLKFNIPGLANDFTRATLRLYHYHTGGRNSLSLQIGAVSAPWKEGVDTYHSGQAEKIATGGEITWIDQPAYEQAPIASFKPGLPQNYVDVDITPLVKAWLTGKPNHGLVISPVGTLSTSTPESSYGFYSREHKDVAKRPRLILSKLATTMPPPSQPGIGSTGQNVPGTPPSTIAQPTPHAPLTPGHVIHQPTHTGNRPYPTGHQQTGHNPIGTNPTGPSDKPVLLLSENFSKGAGKWNVNGQPPMIQDGRAYFVGGENRTLGTNLRLPIEDFAIEFDAYGNGEMISVLVANEKLKLYAASMRRTKTLLIAHGQENIKEFPAAYKPGKWQHYRFVRFGDKIELFVDGKRVAHLTFPRPLEGPALLGFSGLQSTIGLDNIRFYDLSKIPRIGTAHTPNMSNIPGPSQPTNAGRDQPQTHNHLLNPPVRPLRPFRLR